MLLAAAEVLAADQHIEPPEKEDKDADQTGHKACVGKIEPERLGG